MTELTRLSDKRESAPCLKSEGVAMWGGRRLAALHAAMACWGLGTWLGVNGLYVQLPLLVERLPEGWALPAVMTLAVQLANAGLLLYALLRKLRPRASDAPYIYALLAVGALSLFLNAGLHPRTALLAGKQRSVAFIALTFCAALVGCTSSVLFYPYLRHYRDVYLSTYLAGEGLSGFIPSILALIQGTGGDPECVPSADNSTLIAQYPPPRFDTTVFLILLGGLSALSFASFAAIDKCARFRSERVAPSAAQKDDEATEGAGGAALASARWLSVLALMAALNALSNGVLPSVQSYSCMPYGAATYHLAVTLGAMAQPAACLVGGRWLVGPRSLALLLVAALLPLAYILSTALLSPTPPLQHRAAGSVLVVSAWVCAVGLVSYGRMWVYGWARRGGARGMRACGAVTQLGSAVGALLLYALVEHTALFVQPVRCPAAPL